MTYHLLSTIWPFVPHKPYIFWKLMTRPIQITSSSAIHQLPISSPLVATNNDDIVQNLIQFLVQNSHSLLLSSFTNNYKCKPSFFSSIYVIILLTPDIIYFYFISGPAKRETPHSYCWIVIKKWYFPHQISHFWTHFQISNLWSPFWATVVSLMTPH